jgi:uncharacterized membrane protein
MLERTRWIKLALSASIACSMACGDDGATTDVHDAATSQPARELPDDVDAVLEARCRECHTRPTRNFAPFPLETWEDTQDQAPGYDEGVPIYEVMQMRIHDESFPMPPGDREMTDADRKVIDDWIAAGAEPAP